MGIPQRGNHNHLGANHSLQALHLAHLRNTGLDKHQILIALRHQQRQSHSQLRIITAGRAEEFHSRGQTLRNPLLDNGLTIRARNADHRTLQLLAVHLCQTLQSLDRVLDHDTSGSSATLTLLLTHKGSHTALVHLDNIVM